MKKHCVVLIMLICLAFPDGNSQQPIATSNPNDDWEIRWSASDEFNAPTPDWSKWIKTGNLPNTTAWKWDNENNVKINNGVAELTMRQNANNVSDNGTYFKSGILKSYNTFTYGYYEAKIKGANFPGSGVCPSFWLFSNFDYSVPNGQTVYSEIDIVELQQYDWYEGHQDDVQDMDLNLHCVVMENGSGVWRRPKMYPDEQLNKWRASWDPRADFHIYGCEVNENEIIWYVDGVEVARKPNTYWYRPMNVTLSLGLRKPFVEFYDNRNNAVNPETDPEASAALPAMPTTMYVDYVRVWEKTGTSTNPPLSQGELGNSDFEMGTLDYWNASAGLSSVVENNAHSGTYCASVSNSSVAQIVELEPNTTYTVSCYGKVATAGTNAFMGVSINLTNELVANYEFTATSYAKGSLTFTTGAENSSYRFWYWSSSDAYCDDFVLTEEGTGGNDTVAVTGVTVSPVSLSINEGETSALTVSVQPVNATNKNVNWNSDNPSVASVSQTGVVSGVTGGEAIITVTTEDGGFIASCNITVTSSGSGSNGIPEIGQVIWLKSSEDLYVTINNNAGTALQATQTTVSDMEKFSVIDAGSGFIALQSLSSNKYVTASSEANTPIKAGATGIFERQQFTFESQAGGTISVKAKINDNYWNTNTGNADKNLEATSINATGTSLFTWGTDDSNGGDLIAVTGVTVSPLSQDMLIGETITLMAAVQPSDASDQTVSWSTNNSAVATVTQNGVVNAIAEGVATITVTTTDGGFTASGSVVVTNPVFTGIPEVGQIITLISDEGKYLTVNTATSNGIEATQMTPTTLEQFEVVDGDGYLAFKALANNKYIQVATVVNEPLRATATGVWDRQKFTVMDEGAGKISLQAKINNNYCAVNTSDSNKPVEAISPSVSEVSLFTWEVIGTKSAVSHVFTNSDEKLPEKVTIYPNPFKNGILAISLQDAHDVSISIYDLNGKIVYAENYREKSVVEVSQDELKLQKGISFVRIMGSEYLHIQKLILE